MRINTCIQNIIKAMTLREGERERGHGQCRVNHGHKLRGGPKLGGTIELVG